MLDRAKQTFYTDDIAIRRLDGGPPHPGHLTIRHTEVYRLKSVQSASVTHLEPHLGDVFLLGSLAHRMEIRARGEHVTIDPTELVIVRDPEVVISAEVPTDLVLADSQTTVIRGMGLIPDVGPVLTRIPVNRMLAAPLNSALTQAFDLVDAGSGALDARVIDFLHLMSRGLIQLPHDPQTSEVAGVSVAGRARTLIAAAHTSPSTNPTTIADALGVPLRTLQRAFAAQGSSVARELRAARGRTAHALLTAGSTAGHSVSRVARSSGFGSTASMRRALRELAASTGEDDEPLSPGTD